MIFKKFEETDIVAGRITRVASGFWPDGLTSYSQSLFFNNFLSLTTTATPSPSYGTSIYDIRKTMYYLDVFPGANAYTNNDPYLSIAYGNFYGDIGSGSFGIETASIKVSPTKAVYTQYQNLLLGTSDLDGKFTVKSGSTTIDAIDFWVLNFSTYKTKDKIDEGVFQLSISGSGNYQLNLIDDSYYVNQEQDSYQLIEGTINGQPTSPTYGGYGLIYPKNGIVILNAERIAERVGMWNSTTKTFVGSVNSWYYNPNTSDATYTYNHRTFFEMLKVSTGSMFVRKSEYVPARHYFVRIKNRDFNYSNNPTYCYDGTDGVHAKGTIRHDDFIDDPRTYITTIGLYDTNNNLVAVAKLSRPAVKSFDNEILARVRLDF